MSKSNGWENAILDIMFTAVAFANICDNASASPLTNLYISLHTGDPGEGGDQTTNECAYTSYARVAVARSASGWTVTANAVENDNAIDFPEATGGSETATHFAIGRAASGAGELFYSGALTSSLAISSGITPSFAAGDLDVTED